MPTPATTIPGPTPDSPTIAIARLGAVSGRNDQVSDWIDVHFNPASLQLQVTNELKDTRNNERKQYVAKANAKLTMDLQFDTSTSGDDVTQTTKKLQAFVAPPPQQRGRADIPPPVVLFEWGRLKFKGVAESYKETIDFFSANGVPLRSLVNLTLSRQDQVFDEPSAGAPENAGSLNDNLSVDAAPGSPADVARAAEQPNAARSVASSNGEESLRFGSGASLSVSASIELKPPAGFAAGGGGFGIQAGIGIDANLGGLPGGLPAGLPGGLPGVSAGVADLARLSATEGAFAGLRQTAERGASTGRIDTSKLLPPTHSASLSTDRGATFKVGGKATVSGGAGLRANVGAGLGGKLTFES